MVSMFRRLVNDDRGATAIEYAYLGSLIAVAIAAAVGSVGTSLSTTFVTISASF